MDRKIRSVLENLYNAVERDGSTNDLKEDIEFELIDNQDINESNLSEGKVITFNGNTYPREGWVVVMSGATGSGKGVVVRNQLMIDGKVIDVDKLKELYAEVGKIKRGREWDFSNPEDVRKLHNIISAKGWKKDLYRLFFSTNDRLENIIFDITGKTVSKLTRYTSMCDDLGYNVSLVWVVTNRMWAMLRNMMRDRVVPEEIFHEIHNLTKKSVFQFLDSNANRFVNEAWVVFSGDMGKVRPESLPDSANDLAGSVHKISKKGGQFVIPDGLKRKIIKFLGPSEPDINNPKRYKSNDQVRKEMDPYWDEDKGRWVGYDDGVDFMQHDVGSGWEE